GFKERFELEVKGLVDTEHPHVVSILARGDYRGIPYFVIQFLRGGSLEDRIGQRPEEPRDVLGWLPYIADALDFIHGKNIVHRDVKPANILFDESGNVFLSDFGVAKALGQDSALTSVGFTVGSPHYMAPEQATGGDVGPASDQYALAVTGYESLAQTLPFDGTNPLEILVKKGSQDPKPLRGIRDIPAAVSDV
ncbi:MAG: serine/threonine protein kinase, partial [Planctomycetes bacterium]|nr:serine/threonine protein kinase [Planctomycetota bacterium]